MISINSNPLSLHARFQLSKSSSSLSTAIERLSSGLRINSAKDDAAGLAISNRMEANLRADRQVSRGMNDGISLVQTAEGGLDEINNLLQRARQLAVQAATGTLSESDRISLNDELSTIREGIHHIAQTTEIFGKYPLAAPAPGPTPLPLGEVPPLSARFPISGSSGSFTSGIIPTAYIPLGATNITITIDSLGADDDIQLFTRDGLHLVGTPLSAADPVDVDRVWTNNGVNDTTVDARVLTEANGFLPGATYSASDLLEGPATYDFNDPSADSTNTYNGMTFRYSGDGDRYESHDPADPYRYNDGTNGPNRNERLHISEATEDLLILVVGSGAFTATVTWDNMPAPTYIPPAPPNISQEIDIVMSASYGSEVDKLTVAPTPADTATLGVDNLTFVTASSAGNAIKSLDDALEKVNSYRGQYGALHNRFEGAIQNLAQQQSNTAAAKSRILDADYAVEVAAMSRSQLLQQAGATVLAQTNQLPRTVLSLLNS